MCLSVSVSVCVSGGKELVVSDVYVISVLDYVLKGEISHYTVCVAVSESYI